MSTQLDVHYLCQFNVCSSHNIKIFQINSLTERSELYFNPIGISSKFCEILLIKSFLKKEYISLLTQHNVRTNR